MSVDVIKAWLEATAKLNHWPSEILLERGQPFEGHPLPARIRKGLKRQCYANAGRLVVDRPLELFYVEGYGMSPGLPPLAHAWCVDKAGRVIDPTWDNPADCFYFGARISHDFLFDYIRRTGIWGLFESPSFWREQKELGLTAFLDEGQAAGA